jgi:50S ribosomal protein L16 3-hydroxylase
MSLSLLGGRSPAAFLRGYWQKRPLLIRQAVPGFQGIDLGRGRHGGILGRDGLLTLAERSDVTSRLVIHHPRRKAGWRWERHDGPFGALRADRMPLTNWTVLVHGVESVARGGWELLSRFSFIPAARIDDLMVSFAAPGGSVGPHVDAYDVFLLQGAGRRRWQISAQRDRSLAEGEAIQVLQAFVPEEEWVLEPGDMLYLPPGIAHLGVAETPCLTYSIGFLAPTQRELVREFCGYLSAELPRGLDPNAIYQDPDLTVPRDSFAIADGMLARLSAGLSGLTWGRPNLEDFVGRLLTRPKPQAAFPLPGRPLDLAPFARLLRSRRGGRRHLTLALPTRGLTRPGRLFINGEAHPASAATLRLFTRLLADRSLPLPLDLPAAALTLFHGWYLAGYLTV